MSEKKEVEALVAVVMQGLSTSEQVGILNKTIQTSLAHELCVGQSLLIERLNSFNEFFDSIQKKLLVLLQSEEENMDLDTAMKLMEKLFNMRMSLLDLQRKIVQGKDLFPADIYSEEERAFVSILKSFNTLEEKRAFIEQVKGWYAGQAANKEPKKDEEFPR